MKCSEWNSYRRPARFLVFGFAAPTGSPSTGTFAVTLFVPFFRVRVFLACGATSTWGAAVMGKTSGSAVMGETSGSAGSGDGGRGGDTGSGDGGDASS